MPEPPNIPATTMGLGRRSRWMRGFVFRMIGLLRTVLRARYQVIGPVPVGPCVVAFHHTSHIDAFMLGDPIHRAGGTPIAMVKAPVFRHWFAGPIVRRAGMIPVVRDSEAGRGHAYELATQHLEHGHCVFVAPQGTVSRLEEFHHLRTGSARLAAHAGVPLVPAVTVGPEQISGPDTKGFRFTRNLDIVAAFGAPIEPDLDPVVTTNLIEKAFGELLAEIREA